MIFRTCAQFTTILRHSHIEFKPSQLLKSNTNWRLYDSGVNLNKMSVVKLSLYKSLAPTMRIYRDDTYELSTVPSNLLLFNLWEVKFLKYHQLLVIIEAPTRISWTNTCATLNHEIFISWFLQPINVITMWDIIFMDFLLLYWVILLRNEWFCYFLHIENVTYFSDILCDISINIAYISIKRRF